MSRLQELINRLCPNGVPFMPLWKLTIWDKRFNGVERYKQPKVITYPYLLAKDMLALEADGDVRLLSTGDYIGSTTEELAGRNLCEGEVVTMPWGGTVKGIKYYKGKFVTADNRIATSYDTTVLNNKFLYYIFLQQQEQIQSFYRGAGIQHPDMYKMLHMLIPLPPLEVQEEIVRILDRFAAYAAELQAELQARREQYEYYRNLLLTFNPSASGVGTDGEQEISVTNWGGHSYNITWKTMGEIMEISRGASPRPIQSFLTESEFGIPWIKIGDIPPDSKYVTQTAQKITPEAAAKSRMLHKGDFILSNSMSFGRPYILSISGCIHDGWVSLQNYHECFTSDFLYHLLKSDSIQKFWEQNAGQGGAVSNLNADIIRRTPIPIPPLELQEKIVAILDRFEVLVNDLKRGLPAEIAAVREQYEYYRNRLLTFQPITA